MFRPAYVNALGQEYRPGRPIHKETRRRVIDLYLTGEGPTAISRAVRVTPGAVCNIIRHYEAFGTCEAFSQGGRSFPSKLSDNVLESIELFKLAKPSMYRGEIRERLLSDGICDRRSVPCLSSINHAIGKKLGLSYKKLSVIPSESQSDTQVEKCNEYLDLTSRMDPSKLHFFDESSVIKTTGNRRYGHGYVGQHAIEVQQYASNANYTVNLLQSVRGIDYYNILIGPSNGDELVSFFDYVTETEDSFGMPVLMPDDIVIMDNCGFHHARVTERAVRDILEDVGVQLVFQPPYSPHLNPCEYAFGQMKRYLQYDEGFSESFTEVAIMQSLGMISTRHCINYFRHCGYLL